MKEQERYNNCNSIANWYECDYYRPIKLYCSTTLAKSYGFIFNCVSSRDEGQTYSSTRRATDDDGRWSLWNIRAPRSPCDCHLSSDESMTSFANCFVIAYNRSRSTHLLCPVLVVPPSWWTRTRRILDRRVYQYPLALSISPEKYHELWIKAQHLPGGNRTTNHPLRIILSRFPKMMVKCIRLGVKLCKEINRFALIVNEPRSVIYGHPIE